MPKMSGDNIEKHDPRLVKAEWAMSVYEVVLYVRAHPEARAGYESYYDEYIKRSNEHYKFPPLRKWFDAMMATERPSYVDYIDDLGLTVPPVQQPTSKPLRRGAPEHVQLMNMIRACDVQRAVLEKLHAGIGLSDALKILKGIIPEDKIEYHKILQTSWFEVLSLTEYVFMPKNDRIPWWENRGCKTARSLDEAMAMLVQFQNELREKLNKLLEAKKGKPRRRSMIGALKS